MKRILLLAAFLSAASVGKAQNVGAIFGFNFSDLIGDVDTTTMKLGFQGGLMAEFQISESFYIQPELTFTLQGADDNVHPEDKVSLNYVALPVVGKIFLSRGFNLQFGPRVAMMVMAQTTHDEIDIQIEDNLKQWDIGGVIGGGYQKRNFSVSARYYHGFADLIDSPPGITVRNQMLQFTVGYFFISNRVENGMTPRNRR